ncbi:MAG: HIT family protein [Magnetococcales bacterium]|nr:HIT family protein [Magnetococcales bacterium]MBF0584758.1 HIT family protein [Magnetococcales bacterium]
MTPPAFYAFGRPDSGAPDIDLHPHLARDCWWLGRLTACQVLLMNDSRYPWLILVPNQAGLTDFDLLPEALVAPVHEDIRRASQALRTLFQPDKLNVASLGNSVPQLHIHVIARFCQDAAWPRPVWGCHPALPYAELVLREQADRLCTALGIV